MKKITIIALASFFIGLLAATFIFVYNPVQKDSEQAVNPEKTRSPSAQLYASSPIQDSNHPDFSSVVDKVSPAVVSISAEKVEKRKVIGLESPFDDFWDRFFDTPQEREREYRSVARGTGFFINPDGYVITNNHIVENAIKVEVTTLQEETYQAKIIGNDSETDLALLKVDKGKHPYVELGDSDNIKVGEWVLAIGNPLGLTHSVTAGIVSAKGRIFPGLEQQQPYQDFIQTDAAINRGNSGGPLINLKGKVVGINSIIFSPSGGNIGIGFAISANLARSIVEKLKKEGRVIRGYLGVGVYTVNDDFQKLLDLDTDEGAVINNVDSGSPADKAGLKRYDVIISINGNPIEDGDDLQFKIAEIEPGTKVDITVIREGKKKTMPVEIVEKETSQEREPVSSSGKNIGLKVQEMTSSIARRYGYKTEEGLIITEVERYSEADRKGLETGDIILEVNRKKIEAINELERILNRLKSGDPLLLLIRREDRRGGSQDFMVTLRVPE
ncbi:MAG: Do family serine endopeptidase [Candidatus Aminicenantes bacterium]|nr:Do family serine endopeptidase [Candidatus Aminicenantes bacterium]